MDIWERFRPPFVVWGETSVLRLLWATSCPRLLDGLAVVLQLLLLLQLQWDAVSPSSPHLREMGLSTPGCSVCTFLSLDYVACQENRSLKNLMEQEHRTCQRNSRIMK